MGTDSLDEYHHAIRALIMTMMASVGCTSKFENDLDKRDKLQVHRHRISTIRLNRTLPPKAIHRPATVSMLNREIEQRKSS